MPPAPVITLLTDFGLRDPFVGAMKGVIAGIAPRARVVDISHLVEPQDIEQGGWIWRQAVPYFPPGTIHVAVVDPGVGGGREIVAVRARGAVFLAPDNGILGWVVREREIEEARLVRRRRYFLPQVSRTFHGRDIFAPVAARIARGLELSRLGPRAGALVPGGFPEPLREPLPRRPGWERITGRIIDVDRFGNLITNISLKDSDRVVEVKAGRHRLRGLRSFYGEVPEGKGLALISSSGFLELAVRGGRADRKLLLKRSQPVVIILEPARGSRG